MPQDIDYCISQSMSVSRLSAEPGAVGEPKANCCALSSNGHACPPPTEGAGAWKWLRWLQHIYNMPINGTLGLGEHSASKKLILQPKALIVQSAWSHARWEPISLVPRARPFEMLRLPISTRSVTAVHTGYVVLCSHAFLCAGKMIQSFFFTLAGLR